MERLNTLRTVHKTALLRLMDSLPLEIEAGNAQEIKIQLELLESKSEKLQLINEEILKKIRVVDLAEELEDQENFNDLLFRMRAQASEAIGVNEKEDERVEDAGAGPTRSKCNLLMPKAELKPYDGSVLGWTAFLSLFSKSVHTNNEFSKGEKFNFLSLSLKGKAALAIDGLPIDDDHYDDAIEILTRRFGRQEEIVEAHTQRFLNLPVVGRVNDATGLRRLYDQAIVHVRALKDIEDNGCNGLFRRELIKKFPEDLRVQWHKAKDSAKKTLNDALEFLLEEVEGRERSQVGESTLPSQTRKAHQCRCIPDSSASS